jgi:hypothetical protein
VRQTRSVAERSSLPLYISKLPALVVSMMKDLETRRWNTSKLGLRIGADAVAAGAAGILVAPIITMIDKGIIENASGRNTLGDSLKGSLKELVSRPHRFLGSKPFALIYVRLPLPPYHISLTSFCGPDALLRHLFHCKLH